MVHVRDVSALKCKHIVTSRYVVAKAKMETNVNTKYEHNKNIGAQTNLNLKVNR
jgi:hypothetical protein